jgi:hypothetical protein
MQMFDKKHYSELRETPMVLCLEGQVRLPQEQEGMAGQLPLVEELRLDGATKANHPQTALRVVG